MTQLKAFKTAFITLIIILIIGLILMFTNVKVSTTVELEPEQITLKDDQYYILFEERALKLSDNSLKHIELDTYQTYKITYSYNKLISGKGKVIRLEAYGKKMPNT